MCLVKPSARIVEDGERQEINDVLYTLTGYRGFIRSVENRVSVATQYVYMLYADVTHRITPNVVQAMSLYY